MLTRAERIKKRALQQVVNEQKINARAARSNVLEERNETNHKWHVSEKNSSVILGFQCAQPIPDGV